MAKIKHVVLLPLIVSLLVAFNTGCDQIKKIINEKIVIKKSVKEEPTDVVKLKSGTEIIGKILKETPDSVLIRTADGTMEITALKKQIVNIRKATADDMKAAQDELAKSSEAAKKALFFEKEREKRLKEYYEERNKREIAAASKGQSQASSVEAIRDAKDGGKIIKGMSESDVLEVYGPPDSKERDVKGNAERERWYYNKCGRITKATITFYNGKVD